MHVRDKARSDLYLAQLRSQSAPNTPGFPGMKSPRFPPAAYSSNPLSDAEEGNAPGARFVEATSTPTPAKPFQLQPPPIKIHAASPKTPSDGFKQETNTGHAPIASGEQQYAAVPIPGAYQPASPPPQQTTFGSLPGMAVTTEGRFVSPPGSPSATRTRFA